MADERKKSGKPIKSAVKSANVQPPPQQSVAPFIWAVFAAGGLLFLWAFGSFASSASQTAGIMAAGWGQYAAVIVDNKNWAILHAAFMTLCAAAFLWTLIYKQPLFSRTVVALSVALVFLVAFDAVLLSRHYIKTMPASTLRENDIIKTLKSRAPEKRVALLSHDGFYNLWLTYLFPYHNILTIEMTQAPRLAPAYQNYLSVMGRSILRYWRLSAVEYVLAPAQAWAAIQNNPQYQSLKDALTLVYSYNVIPEEMGVRVIPGTVMQPGQHVLLQLQPPAPRFALINGWKSMPDDEALDLLASDRYPLFDQALIPPDFATNLASLDGHGMSGSVQLMNYRSGLMHLKVTVDQPSILRVSEKFDPDWKAWINGKPAGVFRCDYIAQGIMMPTPGVQDVILKYSPSMKGIVPQVVGLVLMVGAAFSLLVGAFRKKPA